MKIDKFNTLNQVNKAINKKVSENNKFTATKSKKSISLEALIQTEFVDIENLNNDQIVKKFIKVILIQALGENIIDHSKYSDMNQNIFHSLRAQPKLLDSIISEIHDCVK